MKNKSLIWFIILNYATLMTMMLFNIVDYSIQFVMLYIMFTYLLVKVTGE